MGTHLSGVILVVGVNDVFVGVYGDIVCFLSDGENGAEKEGPVFFPDVSYDLFSFIDSFNCSIFSNFSELVLYLSCCFLCFRCNCPGHCPWSW